MGIELSGFAYDSAGAPLTSKAVKVYDKNTTANARASTTTHGTTGAWTVSNADVTVSSVYQMDVEITDGDNKVRYKYDDEIMLQRVDVADLVLRSGSASQYVGGIATTTLTADRTWTFQDATGTIPLIVSNAITIPVTSATVALIDSANRLFINETASTTLGNGICINNGGATEPMIELKHSGVAHGLTGQAETDTFANLGVNEDDVGGLNIQGFTDTAHANSQDAAVMIRGFMKATVNSDSNNTAHGVVTIVASEHDGSNNLSALGADENILTLKKLMTGDDNTTTHIFKGDGDIFIDGSNTTTYDDYNDVALLTAWNGAVANENRFKEEFKEWVDEYKHILEKHDIISSNNDGSFHYSIKNLNSLMVGAIRQLSSKVNNLETKLALKGGS